MVRTRIHTLLEKFPTQMRNHYFLMRHGESQANTASIIVSAPENGLKLYGLTARGRDQAHEAARHCGLPSSTLVVASDFRRTRETASVVMEVLRIREPMVLEQGLRERYFGRLEGCSSDRYKEVWNSDTRDADHPPYGVESARHLSMRLLRVLRRLESEHSKRYILVVSHGDPLRFLELWARKRPLEEHAELPLFQPAEVRTLPERPLD